ncbi:hypothetical protein QUW56_02670 [Phocaeicola barnesiae]|uniref:hypothetical protein n=1 Tax=Phocaeicola barnesiae TaxID=376804 RepID=UPI0025A3BCCA|nr:hypothetical protein [Phocaeicola barnesiae]MDM8232302.1 hypothetical protein [Phocaeicola barnesiae]
MTYIDYINQFWQIRRYKPMTAHEADFYFFLLKECNIRNWLCPFELPTRLIQAELGYSNKTVIDLRNRLKQKGLIDFIEGNRREKAASYILLVTSSNQNGNQTGNQSSNQNGNQTGNPIIKTKNKTKNINNSGELFPPEEEKPKKVKAKKTEFITPTLDQVKAYFEGKLPDWEKQAEIFFYHFDSLSWKNTNGARIERWDSRANLWIIEKQLQNGNTTTDNGGGIVTVTTGNGQTGPDRRNSDTAAAELEKWIDSIPIG